MLLGQELLSPQQRMRWRKVNKCTWLQGTGQEGAADSWSIPATNPSPGHCPGAGSCFQSVGLQLILQQCHFCKTLPSTVLNERKKKPSASEKKGETRFKPVGWVGFWAGILGEGCQPQKGGGCGSLAQELVLPPAMPSLSGEICISQGV